MQQVAAPANADAGAAGAANAGAAANAANAAATCAGACFAPISYQYRSSYLVSQSVDC